MLNCYNPETNDCDGSCQGSCDCPFAQYFRGERKHKPKRKTMLKYKEALKKYNQWWRDWLRSDEAQILAEKIRLYFKSRRNIDEKMR